MNPESPQQKKEEAVDGREGGVIQELEKFKDISRRIEEALRSSDIKNANREKVVEAKWKLEMVMGALLVAGGAVAMGEASLFVSRFVYDIQAGVIPMPTDLLLGLPFAAQAKNVGKMLLEIGFEKLFNGLRIIRGFE